MSDTEFNTAADTLWDRTATATERKAAAQAIRAHLSNGGAWPAAWYGAQTDTHARIARTLAA